VTGHLISTDASTDHIEHFQDGGPLDEKSEPVGVLIGFLGGQTAMTCERADRDDLRIHLHQSQERSRPRKGGSTPREGAKQNETHKDVTSDATRGVIDRAHAGDALARP